ncbi:hypothetical protein RRG08_051553 [Elysia crispata]|uniref:Uncharacterized protein n=1 Tax=Elysia crispata TaxID=231223 RepID=A0AAE0Y1U2_9GAST|nr:hypothetical protein RRG08_051553 [Elysia crispata]
MSTESLLDASRSTRFVPYRTTPSALNLYWTRQCPRASHHTVSAVSLLDASRSTRFAPHHQCCFFTGRIKIHALRTTPSALFLYWTRQDPRASHHTVSAVSLLDASRSTRFVPHHQCCFFTGRVKIHALRTTPSALYFYWTRQGPLASHHTVTAASLLVV